MPRDGSAVLNKLSDSCVPVEGIERMKEFHAAFNKFLGDTNLPRDGVASVNARAAMLKAKENLIEWW